MLQPSTLLMLKPYGERRPWSNCEQAKRYFMIAESFTAQCVNKRNRPRFVAGSLLFPTGVTPMFYWPVDEGGIPYFNVYEMDRDAFSRNTIYEFQNGKLKAPLVDKIRNTNTSVSEAGIFFHARKGRRISSDRICVKWIWSQIEPSSKIEAIS